MKAPIDNLFQLGVTRAPNGSNGHHTYNANTSTPTTATTNGNAALNKSTPAKQNGQSNGGCSNGGSSGGSTDDNEEPESLQYIKPANDDLTIAYSEGAQKTDLLY